MQISEKLKLLKEGYGIENIDSDSISSNHINESFEFSEFNLLTESINSDFNNLINIINESDGKDVNPIVRFIRWLIEKLAQFIKFVRNLFKNKHKQTALKIKHLEDTIIEMETALREIKKNSTASNEIPNPKKEKILKMRELKDNCEKIINYANTKIYQVDNKLNTIKTPNVLGIISDPERIFQFSLSKYVNNILNVVNKIDIYIYSPTAIKDKEDPTDEEIAEYLLFKAKSGLFTFSPSVFSSYTRRLQYYDFKNYREAIDYFFNETLFNNETGKMGIRNPEEFVKKLKEFIDFFDKDRERCIEYTEQIKKELSKFEKSINVMRYISDRSKKLYTLRLRAIKICIDAANYITNYTFNIQNRVDSSMDVIQKLLSTRLALLNVINEMYKVINKLHLYNVDPSEFFDVYTKKVDEIYSDVDSIE